ncbi:restriction endonuclease FokI C-terminal domain-containing protein, partial [Oligella urethralis]|uniref:restriction endonuclease FokI C-terminal domain-containing protein n=1 Tax=Oligella urethralis TaxID=90245 RepID=UPI000562EA58
SIPANNFYFLWISGKFQRNFDTQINQLNYETGYRGGALSARQFLIGADAIQKGKIDINDLPSYFNNSVISFE